MRKSSANAVANVTADLVLTPINNTHPLDRKENDELLEAFVTATARYVESMGFAPDEWFLVQAWARKTPRGYTNDIRVSINNEYMGQTKRPYQVK